MFFILWIYYHNILFNLKNAFALQVLLVGMELLSLDALDLLVCLDEMEALEVLEELVAQVRIFFFNCICLSPLQT